MRKTADFITKILSLGVGLAITVILVAKVCFELSYDGFYRDIDHIYRIRTSYSLQGTDTDYYQVSGGVAPGFRDEVPGVVAATRYTGVYDTENFFDEEGNPLTVNLVAADSCFFDIFDREFLAGDPVEALKGWNGSVAVSRSIAERLGGVQEALGKTIWNESQPDLKLSVAGVYEDFPLNGSLDFDALISIRALSDWSINNWMGNDRYVAYLRLAPGIDPKSLAPAIRKMQEAHQDLESLEKNGASMKYFLSGFKSEHRSIPEVRNMVFILSIVAVLLLLVSVMNYVLVAISDVIRRSREVGVRKCFGAGDGTIYALLFRETAVNLLASLSVAALIILAFRGPIETLVGVAIGDMMIPQTLAVIAIVIVIVFLLSAMIPARMFIRIPVSTAFRGYKDSKRRWKLSLLALQFAVNAVLLSLMIVVSVQYRRSVNADPGYDYEDVAYAYIPSLGQDGMYQIAHALRALPQVEAAELTYTLPLAHASGNNIYLPGDSRELFNIADEYGATEGFFDLMGFRLIEGSAPKGPRDIAVSRSFVEKLGGYTDLSDGAVGKGILVTEHSNSDSDIYTICGVYEDYLIGSMQSSDDRPSVRFCWDADSAPEWAAMKTVVVKFRDKSPESIAAATEAINDILRDSPDGHDVSLVSYSDTYRSMYEETDSMRRTFTLGALFALVIAIVGLVGYVRDENYRRSAEIAVRKVNGAQSSEIVVMLVADILKLAVGSVLIGDIGAWFIARSWLTRFSNALTLGVQYFLLADLIILAIVVLTVVWGSLRIARSNPVISLKQE